MLLSFLGREKVEAFRSIGYGWREKSKYKHFRLTGEIAIKR